METTVTKDGGTQPAEGPDVRVGPARTHDSVADDEQRQVNAVEAYAQAREELSEDDERDALDWLLGPRPAMHFDVEVEYDTPSGRKPLTFVVHALDHEVLEAIEQRNVNATTGRANMADVNAQIVAEATVEVRGVKGAAITLDSTEFRTQRVRRTDTKEMIDHLHVSAAEALKGRFRTQYGLVIGIAAEVRALSGFDAGRVKDAKRRLVTAAGN